MPPLWRRPFPVGGVTVAEVSVKEAIEARVRRLMAKRAELAKVPVTWANRVEHGAEWVALTAQINAALETYNEET